jgi:type VI secretion system protein ImpL
LFSPNGIFDTFFKAHLQDLVDTSSSEWHALSVADGSIALSSSTIAQFQQATKIRDAFFPGGGAIPKVQFELRPVSLDDRVALFSLNVEGQEVRNQHGPEQASVLQWPGAAGSTGVRMTFRTLDGQDVTTSKVGPWAWFRLLEASSLQSAGGVDRFRVTFQNGGYRAVYELRAGSVQNPFNLGVLRKFRCPEGL